LFFAGTQFNPFDIVNVPPSLVNFASDSTKVNERLCFFLDKGTLMARKFADDQLSAQEQM